MNIEHWNKLYMSAHQRLANAKADVQSLENIKPVAEEKARCIRCSIFLDSDIAVRTGICSYCWKDNDFEENDAFEDIL